MATVTLHSSAAKARPVESLPAYWSSLWQSNATPTSPPTAPKSIEKPSAVVGDLWIQIR